MSFQRANSAHLDTLKAEVFNDPADMGYGVKDGDVKVDDVLKLLNDPGKNKSGGTINRDLTVRLVLESLDPIEYAKLAEAEREYLGLFLRQSPTASLDPVKSKLAMLFPADGPTRQNLGGLSRPVSRAEALFGADTVIDRGDLIAARDGGVI